MDKDAEDIGEFEEQELQYDLMVVSSHFSRESCFAHTLQLVQES